MNLLVTGAWQGAKDGIEQLKMLGHQVQFLQFEKDELPCSYEWVEGVICNGLPFFGISASDIRVVANETPDTL